MKSISFDSDSARYLDLSVWTRAHSNHNSEEIQRLLKNLAAARQEVLTLRQQQMVTLYYDQRMTIGQIAIKLGLNRSTVSRTLRRSREKLYQYLHYAL